MIKRNGNAVAKAAAEAKVMTAVTPQLSLGMIHQYARDTRNAALLLSYSVTLFLVNVCHLHDANAEGYMSQRAALDEIEESIEKQTDVKGGMLSHIIRAGAELYSKLVINGKPTKVGAPIVKALADAKNSERDLIEVQDKLAKMMKDNAGVQSFRDLSRTMGFKSFQKRPTDSRLTKDKAVERVTNAVASIAKAVGDTGKLKGTTAAAVTLATTQAVANAAPNPVMLAREALIRCSKIDTISVDEFGGLIELAQTLFKSVQARLKAQAAERKATASAKKADKKQATSKTPKAHVIANRRGAAAAGSAAVHTPNRSV